MIRDAKPSGTLPSTLLLLVALAVIPGCQGNHRTGVPPLPPVDEFAAPEPEELLVRMAAFMKEHSDYSFEALSTYQSRQESGQSLHFDLRQRLLVSQPDRLFWQTIQDDARTDSVWYSGGKFSMLKLPDNIYGQIDVPNTIPEMIAIATTDYGIVVPFSDLLASGDESVFLRDLETSQYVGLAWIEGEWTHHIALTNALVDFELWIQAQGDPVLSKLAITWKLEEGHPGYVARFREWKFSPSFSQSQFEFDVPKDAEKIEIIPASAETAVGS